MKLRLLQLLQGRPGQWLDMEALCHELSSRPRDIVQAAGALQSKGFQIEVSPVSGYRYVVSAEPLWPELLKPQGCRLLGRQIRVVQTTSSTNDLAREAASDRNNDGLVIFAEFQTAGRGRQGTSWISPAGMNLLLSVLLFDQQSRLKPHLLTLASGLALARAVREVTSVPAKLKWPNDLLIDSQKAGGILVEICSVPHSAPAVIIGIGLNCNCQRCDLPGTATSLREVTGQLVDRHGLARSILKYLDEWIGICLADCRQEVRRVYLELADLLGRSIKLTSQGRQYSGRVVDLDPFQGILVQLDHGGVRLFTPAGTTLLS